MPFSQPQSVQIIEPTENGFDLNETALTDILDSRSLRNKQVAVISVAGAFRKGKSFLLNFFVLYLEWLEQGCPTKEWFNKETILNKFHWRSGSKPDTHGIHIWSHPFILQDIDGEEIVILLMDSQGTFDSKSTVHQCASIFALSTLLSTMQIYNLSMNLQEDDLQHLTLFTEMAKHASSASKAGEKPFQSLMFLIRDWSNSDEFKYGFNGGQAFLEDKLKTTSDQPEELKELRRNLQSSFDTLECFLMPHPGLEIANNNKKSTVGVLSAEFETHLLQFVPAVFEVQYLIPKIIGGRTVSCGELVNFFRIYTDLFSSGNIPKASSVLEAMNKTINIIVLAEAKTKYEQEINEAILETPPIDDLQKLDIKHESAKRHAKAVFNNVPKLGNKTAANKYLDELDRHIERYYENVRSIVRENQKLKQRRQEQERLEKERQEAHRRKQQELQRQREEQERLAKEEARRAAERAEKLRQEQLRLQEEAMREKEEMELRRREQERRELEQRERWRREQIALQELAARKQEEMERQRQEQERREKEQKERMRREEEREQNRLNNMRSQFIPEQSSFIYVRGPSVAQTRPTSSPSSNVVYDNRCNRYRDTTTGRFCKNPVSQSGNGGGSSYSSYSSSSYSHVSTPSPAPARSSSSSSSTVVFDSRCNRFRDTTTGRFCKNPDA